VLLLADFEMGIVIFIRSVRSSEELANYSDDNDPGCWNDTMLLRGVSRDSVNLNTSCCYPSKVSFSLLGAYNFLILDLTTLMKA